MIQIYQLGNQLFEPPETAAARHLTVFKNHTPRVRPVFEFHCVPATVQF